MLYFYSADLERGSRRIDDLPHQDDPDYWYPVPITTGVELRFLIEASNPLERIIQVLTASKACHVETAIDTSLAAAATIELAESKLGMPYDVEGALASWKDSGYHTVGHEYCSGMAYEILTPILQGLEKYPNPGRLLLQVTGMTGQTMPKLDAPPAKVNDADMDWLQSLVPERIATGTFQEVIACLT